MRADRQTVYQIPHYRKKDRRMHCDACIAENPVRRNTGVQAGGRERGKQLAGRPRVRAGGGEVHLALGEGAGVDGS